MAIQVLPSLRNPAKELADILVGRGLLKAEFRPILAAKDLLEFDRYLLGKKLIAEEDLAKAYAQFFRLPFVRLVNRPIKPEIARLLPEDVARRYMVVVYDLPGPNLHLAVGEPARLQRNAPAVLVNLRQQKGLQVHLAISPRGDVEAILRKLHEVGQPSARPEPKPAFAPAVQHRQPPPETTVAKAQTKPPTPAPKPVPKKELVKAVESRVKPIDLRQVNIPLSLLQKIPYNVAQRYKLLVFGEQPPRSQFEPSLIKVALVNPDEPHIREIISYIESRNKVLLER